MARLDLDDDLLAAMMSSLDAVSLCRAAQVSSAWRKSASEVLRHRSTSVPHTWSTGMATRDEAVRDDGHGDDLEMLLSDAMRRAQQGLEWLPDLAIVLTTNNTRNAKKKKAAGSYPNGAADLVDAAAAMLPAHTFVMGATVSGVIGPNHPDIEPHMHITLLEVEDQPAVVLSLAHLRDVDLSWASIGTKGQRSSAKGIFRRHARAWWQTEELRAPLPLPRYDCRGCQPWWPWFEEYMSAEDCAKMRETNSVNYNLAGGSGPFLAFVGSDMAGWANSNVLDMASAAPIVGGGIANRVAFRPPSEDGTRAERSQALLLQIRGAANMSVVTVPEHAGHGESVSDSLQCFKQRKSPGAPVIDGNGEIVEQEGAYAHARPQHLALAAPLPPPRVLVAFTCNERGERFHNEMHADARAISGLAAGTPAFGFFGLGELGPSNYLRSLGAGDAEQIPDARELAGHVPPENVPQGYACVVATLHD